ncbi:major facilitator superfamily domain-containing protein [Lophiotrema nucula]|uniref:Major facilitator superfamily domain-containing protein n=1 Tax=Lophiotrema nucula TaxID=690887 RepID=A0A6A5YM92_9PLEO|nr:major facilitator superfamily domain-containing protein [Lophiotrema nucula]
MQSNNNQQDEYGGKTEDRDEHLEQVQTRTLPGSAEMEKGESVTKVTTGPLVHDKVSPSKFIIGSQIPLYFFGSILPTIYQDIGGVDRYVWFVIGSFVPNAAVCPFVGALSDLFGRQMVAIVGKVFLSVGPIITSTAKTMNIAIAEQVFSGLGAGLNELIALAGTGEMVPVRKRAKYVGLVVFSIVPFIPSTLYAQLISKASGWRYNGIFVGVWNFIGLVLCIICYHDPPRLHAGYTAKDVLCQVNYVGAALSTVGITLFIMGMHAHNVAPFFIGLVFIIAFFVWEIRFAPYPMAPKGLFRKSKKTMITILLITFLSGGSYFAMLLFWPTQTFNVYGYDHVQIGLRALPIGFGIIGGAVISLLLIPTTGVRIRGLMIFFTALMTAGTGAISVSNPHNRHTMLGVVTIAGLGVGGVMIPSSIIAQIACPDEFIATVTAITLSLRYIGGAIGFAAYDNTFYHEFVKHASDVIGVGIIMNGIVAPVAPANIALIGELVALVGNAQFAELQEVIATNLLVLRKDAISIVIVYSQEAFALGYRYPY